MSTFREAMTTIVDFTEDAIAAEGEPRTQVRSKKLSGGATMWQARLVLSTLDPTSTWATKVGQAIRQGNEKEADELLDAIYARNTVPPQPRESTSASMIAPASSSVAGAHTTVLPPSPHTSGRVA